MRLGRPCVCSDSLADRVENRLADLRAKSPCSSIPGDGDEVRERRGDTRAGRGRRARRRRAVEQARPRTRRARAREAILGQIRRTAAAEARACSSRGERLRHQRTDRGSTAIEIAASMARATPDGSTFESWHRERQHQAGGVQVALSCLGLSGRFGVTGCDRSAFDRCVPLLPERFVASVSRCAAEVHANGAVESFAQDVGVSDVARAV